MLRPSQDRTAAEGVACSSGSFQQLLAAHFLLIPPLRFSLGIFQPFPERRLGSLRFRPLGGIQFPVLPRPNRAEIPRHDSTQALRLWREGYAFVSVVLLPDGSGVGSDGVESFF